MQPGKDAGNAMKHIGRLMFFTLCVMTLLTSHTFARVVQDPEFGFRITVPDNWQTNSFVDGTDKVWAFAAPDNNAAVRIRSFKAPGNLTIDALISAFESYVLSGGQRLTMQPYTLNGINGKMAGYKGQYNNIDVAVGSFFSIQNQHAYMVWSMIPVSLMQTRSTEADAVMNSFSLTSGRGFHHGTPQVQQQSVQITDITTGDTLTGAYSLAAVKNVFASTTPNIYVVFKYQGNPSPEPFLVKWIYKDRNHLIDTATLKVPSAGSGMAKTYMNRPNTGWPPGNYEVEIHHRGRKLISSLFTVEEAVAHAGGCRTVGEVYTDGKGDTRTKRIGGTYLTIPKADLSHGSTLQVAILSGNFKYVTVHARYDGGYWKTAYQGSLMNLPVDQYFRSFLNQPNCTHLAVSVNGAHEKYEPVPVRAKINLCQ